MLEVLAVGGVAGVAGVLAVGEVVGVFAVRGLGEVFAVTVGLAEGVASAAPDAGVALGVAVAGPVGSRDGSGLAVGEDVAAGAGAATAWLPAASTRPPVTQAPSAPVTAQAAVERVSFMAGSFRCRYLTPSRQGESPRSLR